MTTPSPFRRVLGDALNRLPAPVRRFHDLAGPCVVRGEAEVEVTPGALPALIRWFAGLPRAGRAVPVTVAVDPDGAGRERWVRDFAGRRYASTLEADGPRLAERFGPFVLFFDLIPQGDGLAWTLAGWRLLVVPLPAWTVPAIRCRESGEDARFVFDIDVRFPLIGPVMRYRGRLAFQRVGTGGFLE